MHQLWYAVMHSHGTRYGMQGAIRLDERCKGYGMPQTNPGSAELGGGHHDVVHIGQHHLLPERVLEVDHVFLVGLSPVAELVALLCLPRLLSPEPMNLGAEEFPF